LEFENLVPQEVAYFPARPWEIAVATREAVEQFSVAEFWQVLGHRRGRYLAPLDLRRLRVSESADVADDESICAACEWEITEDDEAMGVYPTEPMDDLGTETHQEPVDRGVVLYVHRGCFDPVRYVEAEE